MCQAEFDRQYEVTKLLLDGISTAHVSTVDFFSVELNISYNASVAK